MLSSHLSCLPTGLPWNFPSSTYFFRYSRIIHSFWPAHCNFLLISYLVWLITFGKFVFFSSGGVMYFKFVLTHQRYERFSSESLSFSAHVVMILSMTSNVFSKPHSFTFHSFQWAQKSVKNIIVKSPCWWCNCWWHCFFIFFLPLKSFVSFWH